MVNTINLSYSKEMRIDENLKELMFVRPNIVQIDIYFFKVDGTLRPLISKTTNSVKQTKLTQKDIDKVKKGRTVLNSENINNVRYINVTAPVHLQKTMLFYQ